ncbi:MAG: HAMP domain-containing histidine kinase, partial [Phaeodactylibacter sp.]|nr:HAMP domain-containing histidine kinase [Phaeodactylibacter sp.]
SIAQLPYGQYTLKVRAMGQDGYMAGNELAIPLHSIRPLYLRWWFFLVVVATITGIVVLLFRWRLWQLNRSKLLLEAEVARRTQQVEQKRRTIAAQKAHLEEMNAAKDKLFSIVGHELRGPLMYFGNIANRISYALQKKEYDTLEGLGEKVKNIAGSTNDMLNNLLNWSLLQGGRLFFGQGPADLQAVLEQVTETYQEVAALKKLRIEIETEPGLRVQAGADGLSILLQNLLSNAIKFSQEGSIVVIRTFRKEQQAVIEVKDQGKGMSPQKIQQLFSGAIQPPAKGTAGERGAGLGLQIVREIVKRYNGELRVHSQEGVGSRVTLLLPLAEES